MISGKLTGIPNSRPVSDICKNADVFCFLHNCDRLFGKNLTKIYRTEKCLYFQKSVRGIVNRSR